MSTSMRKLGTVAISVSSDAFALTFDQKSSAWSAVLVSSHTLCRLLPGCDFHCRRFGIELVAP